MNHLIGAVRGPGKRRTLTISLLVFALTAGTALAVALSGNGTIVGSSGADSISAGNANDTVWGLGGADSISAGNGNDVIDGDGHCPPGVKPGVYPNGLPAGNYCEHGPQSGDGGDTISVGSGNDVIYGGGGANSINVISTGQGDDRIYGGPGVNTMAGGNGNDTIYAGGGPDTISVGGGNGTIYAQNGKADKISCAKKNGYVVYADKVDSVSNCSVVKYTSPARDVKRHTTKTRRHAKHTIRKSKHAR